jgi:glutamyl-tRNA synthetase
MVTTRFAPSPTGFLHIGNVRAALMNFLLAKKSKGVFILRIDDTDQERSKQEYVDAIQRDLEWLGLEWDRIEYQSSRLELYNSASDKLRSLDLLYECFETPSELDLKRKKQLNMGKPPVYDRAALTLSVDEKLDLKNERGDGHWRFKLEQNRIEWIDGILNDMSIDAASVSDPVLIRADGQYLYTLASVVDDIEMGITNVVRGSDHVTNTATQIQMIKALGGDIPEFAHHSLLTGPGGEPLSKRLGKLALKDLRDEGIEPAALFSLMARLGSSQPVELRVTLDEVAKDFDLSIFGSAPTKFDEKDLYPLTHRYLQTMTLGDVQQKLDSLGVPKVLAQSFWDIVRENVDTLNDLSVWWNIFSKGAEPVIDANDQEFIEKAMSIIPAAPFDEYTWSKWTEEVKQLTGRKGKQLFMPLRLALTGKERGPDMAKVLPLLQNIKAK